MEATVPVTTAVELGAAAMVVIPIPA